ncbi:MAG: hypothetical protein HC834_10430 [Rhodospirillales bacterium]|nr:hypothetical protein [Rhodospirillales bacterium]
MVAASASGTLARSARLDYFLQPTRVVMRYIGLWLLGVPITGIIVLKVLGLI